MKKAGKVALVLASGGSRGLAHIGAIEVLEERGFEIIWWAVSMRPEAWMPSRNG